MGEWVGGGQPDIARSGTRRYGWQRMAYRYLWTPQQLGPVEVRNRIVFSAHLTNYARDGLPTDQHAAYYAARAAGGTGLIITEEHSTHPTDWPYEKLIHGFHRDVLLMVEINPPATLDAKSAALHANVTWMACAKSGKNFSICCINDPDVCGACVLQWFTIFPLPAGISLCYRVLQW